MRAMRRVMRDIVTQEGASDEDALGLELAVGEALFNAHAHTYHGAAGPVEAAVALDGETFTLTVTDHGESASVPIVPSAVPPDRKRLGLFLISAMMDSVEVRQNEEDGRGLSITMTKTLRPGEPSRPHGHGEQTALDPHEAKRLRAHCGPTARML
jgi:anti-sigma regulatory factor (Ser/Thr protein kinase)